MSDYPSHADREPYPSIDWRRVYSAPHEPAGSCPDCGGDPSRPIPVVSGMCHAYPVGTALINPPNEGEDR